MFEPELAVESAEAGTADFEVRAILWIVRPRRGEVRAVSRVGGERSVRVVMRTFEIAWWSRAALLQDHHPVQLLQSIGIGLVSGGYAV